MTFQSACHGRVLFGSEAESGLLHAGLCFRSLTTTWKNPSMNRPFYSDITPFSLPFEVNCQLRCFECHTLAIPKV